MKGSVLAFIVLVVAGVLLWQHSAAVQEKAKENREFLSLYRAAAAARAHGKLYAAEGPAAPQAAREREAKEPQPNTPASVSEGEKIQSTDSLAAETEQVKPARFRYLPYLAMMLMPLTLAKGAGSAALAWYWTNVALFIIAMFLSMRAVSGTFGKGQAGLYLVPLAAAAPLILFYLPVQGTGLLALVFVLGGLCIFRSEMDIVAGLVSSLALFSPLGVVFALYYVAKRAWVVVGGVLIGALAWVVVAPMIYFGPAETLSQADAYRATILAPMRAHLSRAMALDASENQSVWSMLRRNSGGLDFLGDQLEKAAKDQNVEIAALRKNWTLVVSIVLGVILILATVLGVLRKLRDRELVIVGLEGALLVVAKVLLWPYTPVSSLIVLVFPLFAVTYVILITDVRKVVHHVNYLGLLAAGVGFYAALKAEYLAAGAAFAGVIILWVALLSAIDRFRPHLIRGQSTVLSQGPLQSTKILERPVDLVKARGDEKKEKKRGGKLGGILPMPSFITSRMKKREEEEKKEDDSSPKGGEKGPISLEPVDDKDKAKGTIRLD